MSELTLGQIDFLVDTVRGVTELEIFKLDDKEKLCSIFEEITLGQKRLIHYLIIKNEIEKLIDVMDQLGLERK